MSSKFVHLHVHSHFSLLDGLAKIEQLVDRAKELKMPALALTDHGSMYGAVALVQACKKAGIKPIIGVETYVAQRSRFDRDAKLDARSFHLTLLAESNEGYRNLVKLVTRAHLEGFYYKPRVDKELLRAHTKGIIALSGCLSGEIPRAIQAGDRARAEKLVAEYRSIFGEHNFFLELGAHPNLSEQVAVNKVLVELSQKFDVPLIATNDVHYLNANDADAHDVLLSVQTGSKMDDEKRLTLKGENFSFRTEDEMREIFPELPEALDNTVRIAERIEVNLPLGVIQLPTYPLPEGITPNDELQRLCLSGLTWRYKERANDPDILERLHYELSVIARTGFASYFLIVQDVVNWAKSTGIVVGPGRGSAAGSLVAYVLNITNIDPIAYHLLFERFLNPERISMPDIDLDFADYRRDEVLHYVAEKYGSDRVAQIGTFGTMAARAVIRDAGRALGYPYSLCDRIAKLIPFGMTLDQALEQSQEFQDVYRNEPDVTRLIDIGQKLEGVARHVSTHACGVVISQQPLNELVPVQRATHEESQTITQYEMHAIEDLGLLKMDFLGLRNLSIIEDTINRIKETYAIELDIDTLPLDDEATYRLLANADTTGVFQLESQGMKRYLKPLKPTQFEDIIVMISLYRPGPLDAGMVEEYIARKHGRKQVTYMHPALEPILRNTYGIIVYQEQLMQIANSIAGFTLPEGYTLIKAVGKKIRKLLNEQHEKFISGTIRNGIPQETAEKLWDFIEPFARYGFNRSHAAGYALIAYQTAWLKAHYPAEFLAAMFTHEGTNVDRTAILIAEARDHGIPVLQPDVQTSRETFTVLYERNQPQGIRFGLNAIKNVGSNVVERIVKERQENGPYQTLEDFLTRIAGPELNKKSLESLIMAGALDNLGERRQLLSNIDALLGFTKEATRAAQNQQESLFAGTNIQTRLALKTSPPATRDEKLRWEKELLGLWISEHPLAAHQAALEKLTKPLRSLQDLSAGSRVRVGGVITGMKKILTKKGEPMLFVNIEDMSDRMEVVVFPRVLQESSAAFRENAIVLIDGTTNDRDGERKLLADRAEELIEAGA